MSACCGIEDEFDPRVARRELDRYRKKGPRRTTRMLLDAVDSAGLRPRTLLEIGGGVGAVQAALTTKGVDRITSVEGSPAYAEEAARLAAERGFEEQVDRRVGDVHALAAALDEADLVVLDRVICCDPDMPGLVALAGARARVACASVHPRDRWSVRTVIRVQNALRRLGGSDFRVHVHPPPAIDARFADRGLRPVVRTRTFVWQVVVYLRDAAGEPAGRIDPSPG